MSLAARLKTRLWELSPLVRRPLRRLLRAGSLLRHRWRARNGELPTRVVCVAGEGREPPRQPAIGILPPGGSGADRERLRRWLEAQSETSAVVVEPEGAPTTPYLLAFDAGCEDQSVVFLESLLLVAATLDLPWVVGGWAPASPGHEPTVALHSTSPEATLPRLLRSPAESSPRRTEAVGRSVPQITTPCPGEGVSASPPLGSPLATRPQGAVEGPWHLRGDVTAKVVHTPCHDVEAVLADLPSFDGPPAILFLLPFLAVGGAERLLFDLLPGLAERRIVVVTVEPHRAQLGQTVDRCRELTPYVYTLGDWLPREAHDGALRHLLRRHRVETLVSWNGTVLFYDQVASWRQRFPDLRIFHQLYNHTGAWTDRCGPRLAQVVDGHLAVNRAIVEGLRARRMPDDRIALVHHGVAIPELPSAGERSERRRRARRQLGLPEDATVAGTFIRFHRQKRPLDLVALAARRPDLHFLLVGGGPLEAEVADEIERHALPNLTRLPLRDDLDTLYDALDLCLMTSSYEGLPVFLLDGLARALPAVATAVGEIPELLADGGGEMVERPGDLAAFGRAFDRLADPQERERRGAVGRRTVAERFGLDAYRRRYRRLLLPEASDV